MSDKDLKPCPFCGGEAELNTMGAMCKNKLCGAVVPGFGTTAVLSTIKCWNIRPETSLVGLDEEKLEAFVHKWQNTNLFGDERISNIMISSLIKAISTKFGSPQDNKFINHIKSHLSEGQEVICKICGKTAKEICNE